MTTSFSGTPLTTFMDATEIEIRNIIKLSPAKSCELDPLPTWLLKECIAELVPTITDIVNMSLRVSLMPKSLKTALIRPLLNKTGLDSDILKNYRPVSNLTRKSLKSEWQHRQNLSPHNCAVNLDESLAKGHTSPWAAWRCLNRLRTGVTCSKEQRKRWKYFNGDTTCECGQAPETTKHMLQCPLLAHPCTLDDLQKFNENARKCVDKWKNAV